MNRKKLLVLGTALVALAVIAVTILLNFPVDARLRQAANDGDTAKALKFISRGANVNGRDKDGVTPLMLASAAGRNETARELLRLGADVCMSAHPGNSDTALYYAVLNNHPEMVAILLGAGADPNAKMGGFYSPIVIAARKSSTEVIRVLVGSPRVAIDDRDDRGNTPIMLVIMSDAADEQKVMSLKLLLTHGANPETANANGDTPCTLACRTRQAKIIELLSGCHCKVSTSPAGASASGLDGRG